MFCLCHSSSNTFYISIQFVEIVILSLISFPFVKKRNANLLFFFSATTFNLDNDFIQSNYTTVAIPQRMRIVTEIGKEIMKRVYKNVVFQRGFFVSGKILNLKCFFLLVWKTQEDAKHYFDGSFYFENNWLEEGVAKQSC